jgi:hypothetical protein
MQQRNTMFLSSYSYSLNMSMVVLDYIIDEQCAVIKFLVKMVQKLKYEFLPHSLWSQNFASCDYHLICPSTKH